MSYADTNGMQVEPVRPVEYSDETIERLRDMTAVKLQAKRMPVRRIAQFLGIGRQTVLDRLERIPPDVKERYRREPLGQLLPECADGA